MKRIVLLTALLLAALSALVLPALAQVDEFIEIAYGDEVRGEITDAVPSVFYTFEGEAGDVVTITMIADDTNLLDPYLYLYDGEQNLLISNDDAPDISLGLNSQIVNYELMAGGTYIIEATRWGGQGEYTLTLETGEIVDSGLTFDIPEGWFVDQTDSINYLLVSSEAVLDAFAFDDDFVFGEEDQFLLLFDYVPTTADVDDVAGVLTELQEFFAIGSTVYGDIETGTAGDNVYARSTVDEDGLEGLFYAVYVPGFEDAAIVIQTLGGDMDNVQAVSEGIIASIAFEESDNQVGADGVFVTLPDGWLSVEQFGEIYMATDQVALDSLRFSDVVAFDADQVAMSFIVVSSDLLAMIEIDATTPRELIDAFLAEDDIAGDVADYDGFGGPAAILFAEPGGDIPENALIIVTEYPEGFILWAVQFGAGEPFSAVEPIFAEVIGSATFEGTPIYGD